MKLFTVGPVEMYPYTLKTEGTQLPYFRDEDFSKVMKKCEDLYLASLNAPEGSYFIGLTCSGTGGMDASVQNILNKNDKVLVINGGSFGHRFAEICTRNNIKTDTYDLSFGEALSEYILESCSGKGYTALLVNACETSTGQFYDIDMLGRFCKRNDMLFMVDAISSYLADPLDMKEQNIDVVITSSHKALALSPGVSLIALSPRARQRALEGNSSYYFDFNDHIENQKRGQTPFTPAISVFLSVAERLGHIMDAGIQETLDLHEKRASYFRDLIKAVPVKIPEYPLSNCCTPIMLPDRNAGEIYKRLKEVYGMILNPSGGEMKDVMLRVGHIGNLEYGDFELLIEALKKEV